VKRKQPRGQEKRTSKEKNAFDPQEKVAEGFDSEVKKNKRPTILVCGYTGAGKTSLIKALLGNIVSEKKIGHGRPQTQDFDFYQNSYLSVYDSKGLEAGVSEDSFVENVHKFVDKCRDQEDVDKHIHLVWYCIQGAGARVNPADKRLIKSVFNKNVLVLITKNDITRQEQRDAMKNELLSDGISEDRIIFCSDKDDESHSAIIQKSFEMLPEAHRDAFIAGQIADLEKKDAPANKIIVAAAASAGAIGAANPFPVSDAAVIAPIQFTMVGSLAYLYGIDKQDALVLMGPNIAEVIGLMTASSLSKMIPGFGQMVQATVASTLTTGLGFLTKEYLVSHARDRAMGKKVGSLDIDPNFIRMALKGMKKKAA
jgi:uncharacterized protein (DUF697 family)/ethanolamine utilization protein EutP (predicted NTPase)